MERRRCVCATIHSQLGVFTIQTCCCYTCIVGHKIHTGLKTDTFQGFHYKSTEMFRDRKIQRFLPRTPSCALTFTHLTNSEHNRAGSAQLKNQSAAVFAPCLVSPGLHTASIYPQYPLCGKRLMLQSQDQCEGACTVGCTESIDWSSSSVQSPDVDACAHDMEAFAGLISATQRGGKAIRSTFQSTVPHQM